MAFSQSQLKSDILDVFSSMKDDGDDKKFSDGISQAFKDFVNSGKPQTTDMGTIPTGTFSGASVDGSLKAEAKGCADIIYGCFDSMRKAQSGGDTLLANAIADGLQEMTNSTVVTTSVSGATIPPSPPPPSIPTTGTAKGEIKCVCSSVSAGLIAFFPSMKDMESGGDEAFADKLSSLVYYCLKAGVVTTDGQGNLEGSKGSGNAS